MNERDSEIMAQSLLMYNYLETKDIDSADLIILNTCSIRAKAEQKVMSMLGYLRKNKKNNPQLKICVAGCVAQQEGEHLVKRMPHVNLVVGTQHIYQIPDLLALASSGKRVFTKLSDDYAIPRFVPEKRHQPGQEDIIDQPSRFRKFVTIMQGCNNYCTYCVVPYTRGREVSRKVNDILDEVKVLVGSGVQEITLLGQNVNSYGLTNQVTNDGTPCTFPLLLQMVSEVKGVRRLRFTTSNPKDLSDDLMRCFRDLEVLCPQFHLPVQAGSNGVLQRMNRKYTIEKYIELVRILRSYCPDIVLTTDVIVGFPGETEEDFEKTMELLEEVQFDGSFSFKYSDRPGTASLKLSNKVSEEDKSVRLSRFQKRQDEISFTRNSRHIGNIINVMVEKCNGEMVQCRAATNHIVHIKTNKHLASGDNLPVKIVHAGCHSLKGLAVE